MTIHAMRHSYVTIAISQEMPIFKPSAYSGDDEKVLEEHFDQ